MQCTKCGKIEAATQLGFDICVNCINKTAKKKLDTGFKKFDTNKPATDLLAPDYILGISEILGFGAEKYGKDNWKQCEEPERYYAAALRHLLQWKQGDHTDEESGKNHLLHAAASIMFLFELTKED